VTELAEMVGIYARKIMELERRLAEAELAIVEHNDGCEQACMAGAKDRCLSYTSRNLQCPDCPRDWMITYDAALAPAAQGTPGGGATDPAAVIHAQHDETGRVWVGLRRWIPKRFTEIETPPDTQGAAKREKTK